MPKGDAVLDRVYGPADLAPDLAAAGIGRTVVVQAAPTVDETEYMLGLADATPSVAAVVGWIDFEDRGQAETLSRLKGHPKFRGVRPMIQDIADDNWMLRPEVQWAYETLAELGLTFDALGFPRHLRNFLTILRRYPDMRTVLDHCMKPRIRGETPESFRHWAEGMARIAGETGAFCKFSALITEDGADWSADRLRPYADHVLKVFGPARVMWGSDWPVCRLRAEYGDWHAAARTLTAHLNEADRARVFGGTAAAFYAI